MQIKLHSSEFNTESLHNSLSHLSSICDQTCGIILHAQTNQMLKSRNSKPQKQQESVKVWLVSIFLVILMINNKNDTQQECLSVEGVPSAQHIDHKNIYNLTPKIEF